MWAWLLGKEGAAGKRPFPGKEARNWAGAGIGRISGLAWGVRASARLWGRDSRGKQACLCGQPVVVTTVVGVPLTRVLDLRV